MVFPFLKKRTPRARNLWVSKRETFSLSDGNRGRAAGRFPGILPAGRGSRTGLRMIRFAVGRRRGRFHGGFRLNQPELLAQLRIDRLANVLIVFEELAGVLAALPDALAFVAEPGAGLLDD